MNKKNKYVLITAVIALVVGFGALIPSVLTTIPYMQGVIEKARQPVVETLVFESQTPIQTVTIAAANAKVRIEQTDAANLRVVSEDTTTQTLKVAVGANEQVMDITSEITKQFPKLFGNAKTFVQDVANLALNNQLPTIVVQVPKSQPINLVVNQADFLTIVDSQSIAENLTVVSGMIEITNVSAPTAAKTLTYEQTGSEYDIYGHGVFDYHLLNAFTDVNLTGETITLQNQTYVNQLTTTNVNVEANYINYEMIPFTGTVTLKTRRENGGISLQIDTVTNIDWQIQARDAYFYGYSNDQTYDYSQQNWEYTGYFFEDAAKDTGKFSIETDSLSIGVAYFTPDFLSFVQTQAKPVTSDDFGFGN